MDLQKILIFVAFILLILSIVLCVINLLSKKQEGLNNRRLYVISACLSLGAAVITLISQFVI